MAKITGPLMSLEARGNWAKGTLQFRSGLKGQHAYKPAPPGTVNQAPATEAQGRVRAAYQTVYAEWRDMTGPERTVWNEDAQMLGISGWNLYLKNRLPELVGGPPLPNPDTYTPPEAGDIAFPGTTWVADTPYTPPTVDKIEFPSG